MNAVSKTYYSIENLRQLAVQALVEHNTDVGNARLVVDALIAAEIDGLKGHGLSRLPSYCAQAKSGKVKGHEVPKVTPIGLAATRIDAGYGFAYPALDQAIRALTKVTYQTGIAVASVTHSHHCGAAGYYVEKLAQKGLIGLLFANTPKAIAPWGGRDAVFGTNPIAFAVPRKEKSPLVIDLALSKVARGKIMVAGRDKKSIPEGWALDSQGKPTTDPNAAMYEDLFWTMLQRFRNSGSLGNRKRNFRFKNKLLSLDSTTISLCLNLFPWAQYRRAKGGVKGGVKVHVLLDHDDYMPSFIRITEAKRHDRTVAHDFHFKPGSIVALDRAYNDYKLFLYWTVNKVYFVTRQKENAIYEVVEERPLPQNRPILADQLIKLTGANAQEKCPHLLRRIVVWDKVKEREIVLLTNHLEFGSTTIAAIYKDRWEIEIFFKTLKQHLKIKTFIGTSENALRIQIWTALIALLLLKYLHHLSQFGWSMSNLATMLRLNLFTYRDLLLWLHNPFGEPPKPPIVQLVLPGFGQQ